MVKQIDIDNAFIRKPRGLKKIKQLEKDEEFDLVVRKVRGKMFKNCMLFPGMYKLKPFKFSIGKYRIVVEKVGKDIVSCEVYREFYYEGKILILLESSGFYFEFYDDEILKSNLSIITNVNIDKYNDLNYYQVFETVMYAMLSNISIQILIPDSKKFINPVDEWKPRLDE